MRLYFILGCLLCSSATKGQTEFKDHLLRLINDTTNRFANYKGTFKEILGDDSIFYSNSDLPGTIENTIQVSNSQSTLVLDFVFAIISIGSQEKEGKSLADEWRNIIRSIVGDRFTIKKLVSKSGEYGWVFEKGYFAINISFIPEKRKMSSILLLQISYLHQRQRS